MYRGIQEDEMQTNMRWWNALKDPDPEFVKRIPGGAKLSSIDPMHRAEVMTHVFGPIGIGWGLEVDPYRREDFGGKTIIFVRAKAWFKDPESGDIGYTAWHTGGTEINGRGDDDAVKSAETDAIGKTLSYLGVAASVYLGKHDGDKYQNRQPASSKPRSAAAPKPKAKAEPKPESWIDEQLKAVEANDPGAYVIDFGKHKGMSIAEIHDKNRGYIEYLMKGWTNDPPRGKASAAAYQMTLAYLAEADVAMLEKYAGTQDPVEGASW